MDALNQWGSYFMAATLIAVFIGIIITILAVVAHRQGMTSSLKMNPRSFLVAMWGTVIIVSIPGLIAYGSTFMPAPAVSTATRVDPAYLEAKGDVQKKTGATKEDVITFIGQGAYDENKDKFEKDGSAYAKPTIIYQPASAEDNSKPDSCTALRIQVWRGADRYSGFDTLELAPASYDQATCGELKSFPEEQG